MLYGYGYPFFPHFDQSNAYIPYHKEIQKSTHTWVPRYPGTVAG